MMKYNITQHAKERYIERVLKFEKSNNIFKEILDSLNRSKNITSSISATIPRFILYLKENYEHNINILEDGNIIYILTKIKHTNDTYSVLTCYLKEGFLEQFKNSRMNTEEIYHKLKMLKTKKN